MQEELKKLVESSQYKLVSKLGEGGFGVVYAAIKNTTGEEVALKVMDLREERQYRTFKSEIAMTPNHPNILQVNTHYVVKANGCRLGVMEMEKMEYDLMDYLLEEKTIRETEAREIFKRVCEAVACCHAHQIYHLDIKADNVLIAKNSKGQYRNVKLCDFGHAKSANEFRPNGRYGTPQYLPLEVFSKKYPVIAEKVDVWSLGVLLFTLLTGMFPFVINPQNNTIHCMALDIVKQYCVDDRCFRLLTWIFSEDPADRPHLDNILSHPWFTTGKEYSYTYPFGGCADQLHYYYNNNNSHPYDQPLADEKSKDSKKRVPKILSQFWKLKNRLSN